MKAFIIALIILTTFSVTNYGRLNAFGFRIEGTSPVKCVDCHGAAL